jgi:hypothetical protein
MDEDMESIQNMEDFESRTINLPPASFVEMLSQIVNVESFFDEFNKEVGLGFLDKEELFAVRQLFITFREAVAFEKTYNVSLEKSKMLLVHAAYTYIMSSPSYKGKKLDTIVSRIYRMVKEEEKKKKGFFKQGGEEE